MTRRCFRAGTDEVMPFAAGAEAASEAEKAPSREEAAEAEPAVPKPAAAPSRSASRREVDGAARGASLDRLKSSSDSMDAPSHLGGNAGGLAKSLNPYLGPCGTVLPGVVPWTSLRAAGQHPAT